MLALLAALACTPAQPIASATPITLTQHPQHVEVRQGDRLITRYHYSGEVRQEKGTGLKPLAKPYFWPFHTPNGTALTRAWPMDRGNAQETTDHFHQKSIWFCHGDIIPEGVELRTKSASKEVRGVDFWSEAANHGRIVVITLTVDRAKSTIHSFNEWQTADGVPILAEKRTIRFRSLERGTLLELTAEFDAKFGPVTFGDTKEGSLGVRVRDEFRAQVANGGTITSSNETKTVGKVRDNLPMWGEVAAWHDYSGTLDGQSAGVTIFADPTNPHPSAWHTRAYGLMAANPFGRDHSGFPSQKGKTELVRLAKGESIRFRFGIYGHDGDVKDGLVTRAYQLFQAGSTP